MVLVKKEVQEVNFELKISLAEATAIYEALLFANNEAPRSAENLKLYHRLMIDFYEVSQQ